MSASSASAVSLRRGSNGTNLTTSENPPTLEPIRAPVRYRELRPGDSDRVARLLGSVPHEKHDAKLIRAVWPELIASGSLKGVTIEAAERRVVSVGASVFVKDGFVQELQRGGNPLVAKHLTETAATPLSPICTRAEIARANSSDGVNIFILHSGLAAVSGNEDLTAPVKAQLMQGFMDVHAGYNVKTILVEAYGPEERAMYVDGSAFHVINSYEGMRPDYSAVRDSDRSPCLVGLTRSSLAKLHMHPLLPLFANYTHPRCSFTQCEQALLLIALLGHTDDELAKELHTSLSTVKKRWAAILDKFKGCSPDSSGSAAARISKRAGRKGDTCSCGTCESIPRN